MNKLTLILGLVGLSVFSLPSVPILIGYLQYRAAKPPREVKSLQEFRTLMDDGSFEYFAFAGPSGRLIEARRLLPFWFTFRSGWACYVFDTDGSFLDWTADNGDDEEWDRRWGQLGRGRINIERAIPEANVKPANSFKFEARQPEGDDIPR